MFKWRVSSAASYFAGIIVLTPGVASRSAILLYGLAMDQLSAIGSNGILFGNSQGISPQNLSAVKAAVAEFAGVLIDAVSYTAPPVEPQNVVPGWDNYIDLSQF